MFMFTLKMQKSRWLSFSAFVILPEATSTISSKIRFPRCLHCLFAPHDLAHVHIHKVSHAEVGVMVARDLDDGRDRRARGRTPARRKDHDLRPAGHHAGELLDVMGGCVHIDEPLTRGRGRRQQILRVGSCLPYVCIRGTSPPGW